MSPWTCAWARTLGHRVAALVLGLLVCAGAQAATIGYDILLDTDSNPATGCTITTPKGPFTGVEQVLGTQVQTNASGAQVIGVTLQGCTGAALGAPAVVSPGGWPVGLGVGSQGSAVIETFLPLAQLAGASTIRAGVMTYVDDGATPCWGLKSPSVPGHSLAPSHPFRPCRPGCWRCWQPASA